MITQKKECPMCGKEFPYIDLRNVPNTCGTRMCDTNFKYQQENVSLEGKVMNPDKIKKW